MSLLRLLSITGVIIRFGLDEIAIRSFAPSWFQRLWLLLMFWRPILKPRGIRLRMAMIKLGPIFVKFGQVLSTRQDLFPSDISVSLTELQDKVPPQSFAEIEKAMNTAYGHPWQEVFASFEPQPLGSASVAQVHKAVLLEGREVAVKVLRSQIQNQIKRDIDLMYGFAWLIETFLSEGKRLQPRGLVAEFDRCLHEETDLLHEAANCTQMHRNFIDYPMLRIPEVYWDYCNKEVMVMDLLEGTPVDQTQDLIDDGVDLEKLAKAGIEIFFTQVFRDSFFHADMHPGNLHVDKQGRFIALDFGITGTLSDFDKEYIGANFLAFLNRDYKRVAVMHVEAGWVPPDTSVVQFESAIRSVCEPIFAKPLKEISFGRLLLQLFQVARRFNLIVQPQLALLQKTLLNIEGMGRELAPDLNLWLTAQPFLEDWAKQQRDPRVLMKQLINSAPGIIALLPELPSTTRILLRRLQREATQNTSGNQPSQLNKTSILIGILVGIILTLIFN